MCGYAWNALGVWGLAMLTAGAGLLLLGAQDVLPSWLSDDIGHTLTAADRVLYRAKAAGRDTVRSAVR